MHNPPDSASRPPLKWALTLAALPFLSSFACQDGNSSVEAKAEHQLPGESHAATGLALDHASNGFGQLLPHRAFALDAGGQPTTQAVELRSVDDVLATVKPGNPVLPVMPWPTQALLPTGMPGNHFAHVAFTGDLDMASVLDPAPSAPSGLTGAIDVIGVDPVTGAVVPVQGRAFVGGWTAAGGAFEQWIGVGLGGVSSPLVPEGVGFPGTQGGLASSVELIAPSSFVFVADTDGDLATHETFPAGLQVSVRITADVTGAGGGTLLTPGRAVASVGFDQLAPEVGFGPLALPDVVPAPGAVDVDVATTVELGFTEPVQPASLGALFGQGPALSDAVQLTYGPTGQEISMPFEVRPLNAFDLTRYELVPAASFPGMTPGGTSAWNRVDIAVQRASFVDLMVNANQLGTQSFFLTGEGSGLVNAPVAPDAIYIARAGGGLSVLDLNGFGQSTGNPNYDPANPIVQGNSNFPNNPNVAFQGALMTPPLAPGTGTHDGGSAGVFTLTRDSNLQDDLLAGGVVQSVADLHLGQPLDRAFNNGPPPFGCQSGGGNLCASTGLKLVTPVLQSTATLQPAQPGQFATSIVGAGNLISWAPHPNPPPLTFPPLCVSPMIGGQEPTRVNSMTPINLLGPGNNVLGDPGIGLPPTNLLSSEQNTFFTGPSAPQVQIAACETYQIRQQIGHFLYVADSVAGEVVVLNSNRMTVLDRIEVADPRSLAMSPNLDLLAVSNTRNHTVDFIDIDPASATFHQVVKQTPVEPLPTGIAWQPDNEDILVCHEKAGKVSILSAFSLDVRKVTSAFLDAPFEVAVTNRHKNHATGRDTYFAFILDRSGRVALFESGPDGVNGWGNDDVIGRARFTFEAPTAVRIDASSLGTRVWVTHERALDAAGNQVGAPGTGGLTLLELQTSTPGVLPLAASGATMDQRDLQLRVATAIGASELTGVPTGLALDNQRNLGGLPNPNLSPFAAGIPAVVNGKSLVRSSVSGIVPTNSATYAFVSVASSSTTGQPAIDVIDLATAQRIDTNPFAIGTQSVPASGALGVVDYFRQ